MANILFTNHCNRNCCYCFAGEKLSGKKEAKSQMSLEDLKRVIDFMKSSGLTVFSILGGEPTLHTDFINAFEMVRKARFKHIKLFSNGLIPKKHLEYLASLPKQNLSVIININQPSETPEAEKSRVQETLKTLGEIITLGVNIYRTDMDLEFLVENILKFNLCRNIRLGLAQPILGANNIYLPIESYKKVGKQIVQFSLICDKHDIRIGCDCGLLFCMFDEEDYGKLVKHNVDFRRLCSPIIDIGVDLAVWSCFPLSRFEPRHLSEFKTYDEIYKFYRKKMQPYKNVGVMKECLDCKYKNRGQCTAGCVSHIINSFSKIK